MTALDFNAVPTVAVLQRLVPGSLKQSLAKAVRQWVVLRSLYGELGDEVRLELGTDFSYRDWAKQFFLRAPEGRNYHLRDQVASFHHDDCACAKSLTDWLFDPEYGAEAEAWKVEFQKGYGAEPSEISVLLRTGKLAADAPELRLFGCTGKLLEKDFEGLGKLGWLRAHTDATGRMRRNCYQKISLEAGRQKIERLRGLWHSDSGLPLGNDIANFIQTDLAGVAESMARPIRGVQRFFLHTDYIVPVALSARVSGIQEMLMQCWQQPVVPPVRLVYRSARRYDEEVKCVVYPVCIYYFQRAPYLFAYGQVPGGAKDDAGEFDWYDYRLDHIQDMAVLDWEATPVGLKDCCMGANAPSPRMVEDKMLEAWGFDFYRPATELLLRFDRYFYARYVAGTERAMLFDPIPYGRVKAMVRQAAADERQKCLAVLAQRPREDVYCQVRHRVGDNNVVMRLRAWGANVEVLLPWELRERMAGTVEKLWRLYGEA